MRSSLRLFRRHSETLAQASVRLPRFSFCSGALSERAFQRPPMRSKYRGSAPTLPGCFGVGGHSQQLRPLRSVGNSHKIREQVRHVRIDVGTTRPVLPAYYWDDQGTAPCSALVVYDVER